MSERDREVSLTEARAELTDLINRAQYGGETTIITRHRRPAAIIAPAPQEDTMTDTPVKIILRTTTAGLHRHYAGEEHPQPCYIELDTRDGEMLATWDHAVDGGGVPAPVVHGLVRRWGIPILTAEAANRIMHELHPYAERIVADSAQVWDGSNHIAQLGDDAHAAEAEIRRMLGDDEDCEPSIYDPGADTVTAWDADGAIYGDEVAEYGITSQTSDERLDEICESIRAQLAEVSETGAVILDDSVRDHLYELRDELAESATTDDHRAPADTEIASHHAGRGVPATYPLLDRVTQRYEIDVEAAHDAIHAYLGQLIQVDGTDAVIRGERPMRPELLENNPHDLDIHRWVDLDPDSVGVIEDLIAEAYGETLYWSVVRGESTGAAAVEPHPLGVTIPDEVMTWAEGHGLSMDDPDVYLLVTTEQHAGEVIGEIGSMATIGTVEEARLIRAELEPGE